MGLKLTIIGSDGLSYALSQWGLHHVTIPSHSQSQRYTFPYSGARSQQWMFTQQPALTQSVYLSASCLKLILESPKDAIDPNFTEGCVKCYHNCESHIKYCHWLALRSTTCATWYFIIKEQKNTFNGWQKGRIMENRITMHAYLKLDLNKQILKNLGCKTDAVCTHVHIPGGQC